MVKVDAGRSVQVISIPTGFGVIDAVRKGLVSWYVQYRGGMGDQIRKRT